MVVKGGTGALVVMGIMLILLRKGHIIKETFIHGEQEGLYLVLTGQEQLLNLSLQEHLFLLEV